MTTLSRSNLYTTGKLLMKKEVSKSFIKQVATINNQFIDLKITNVMVEDNIYLNIVNNTIKQSHIQKLPKKSKQLQIRIILNGTLEKLNHLTNKKRTYNKNEISIEYDENIEESLLHKEGQTMKYICITLNEKYLTENGFFTSMLKDTFHKKIFELDLENKFDELFTKEYSNVLDKIYLKNKTMEVILYVFDTIHTNEKNKITGLNEEDIIRIKKVEKILQNSFSDKLTIPLLAKSVALNQTKLKKGFKEIFHKTIYEYLQEIRLKKAILFLKDDRYTIKEVSLLVGYTNQGSFSYAFSQKYLCSPKSIQKKSKM